MMSIAQVRSAGSAAGYYSDRITTTRWAERLAGKGAEQLGLQGTVDKEVFTRVLARDCSTAGSGAGSRMAATNTAPAMISTLLRLKSISMAMLAEG